MLLAVVPLATAHSQYFGRNKVLWEEFQFEILDTEHFSIYYYPPADPAARDVARLSERWYERLSYVFDHQFEDRNPLIIYQDHADFQQTLTTSGLIGEGIGGFTESLQNRVVLPLTGVNTDDDHVLGHELVHTFQFDIMKAATKGAPDQAQQRSLPQWLAEGLAEYLSQGHTDPQTALWMRDAVLHDALPDPQKMNRLELSPYQYGQAVWAYIGGRWGDRTAIRLFTRAAAGGGFDAAVREALQIEPEVLFGDLHASLRAAYQPILDARMDAREVAVPLLPAERAEGPARPERPGRGHRPGRAARSEHSGPRLNIAPALSPDGTHLAFMSSLELFTTDLFLADSATGEVLEKLVSAEADPHFDYLSFIDSSVAWSPDGRRLAFTVFAKGDRRLVLFDVERRSVERELPLAGMKGVSDPAWSPDGRYLVFSAIVDGASDLYRVDIQSNAVTRLTADQYAAIQPAFSPDGRTLVFVTDRGPATRLDTLQFGDLQLALLDLQTLRIEPLAIFPNGKHIDPHFSPDGGSVLFIGEPDGIPDVFRYHIAAQTTERLTALKTGVTGITAGSPALSIAARTGAIAFSTLEDGHLNIYRMEPGAQIALPEPAAAERAAILPPGEDTPFTVVQRYLAEPGTAVAATDLDAPRRPYKPHLDLAYLGPATLGVSVDSYGTGVGGSLSAYFTDPLGTRQIASTVYGGSLNGYIEFADALGGETAYLNQKHRLQWGALGSRLPYLSGGTFWSSGTVEIDGTTMPADTITNVIEVVTASEISLFSQYPFSLNRRVEASVGVSHIGYDARLERIVFPAAADPYREEFDLPTVPSIDLQHVSAAYVVDTSYFGFVSPLRGRRFRAESQWTTGDLDFQTTLLDYRQYVFRKPLTFAFRALHVARRGADAEDPQLTQLDVGRDSLVRGYDLGSFDLSECTLTEGSIACPEFDRLLGSRIAVLNFELRIPLLGNRDFGLFRAPAFPTEAVFFIDAGAAWSAGQSVEWKFDRNTLERVPVVSAGIAARMVVGGVLPIQIYYAVPYQRPREDATFGFMISTGW